MSKLEKNDQKGTYSRKRLNKIIFGLFLLISLPTLSRVFGPLTCITLDAHMFYTYYKYFSILIGILGNIMDLKGAFPTKFANVLVLGFCHL